MARAGVSLFAVGTGVLLLSGLLSGASGSQHVLQSFDSDKAGAAPPGFTFAAWRQPASGRWTIRRAGTNGYLHHEGDARAPGYSLALSPAPAPRDVEAAARLRLAGGGRAGGLVWRYRDDHNYYAAVLDLGRGEVSLWRVSGGSRVLLEQEDDLELDVDAWHVLKIRHDDDEARVYLGGIRVFAENDRRGSRDAAGGRAGVIAQGDAEVWIDDLRVAAVGSRDK